MSGWNGLADRCLDWLLATSWQASVLVVLVIAAQWCFRSVLAARWRYLLWLLVVGRLLLPSLPESPASLYRYIPASPAPVIAVEMSALPEPMPTLIETAPTVSTTPVSDISKPLSTSTPFPWKSFLCLIWVAGVVTLAIWLLA